MENSQTESNRENNGGFSSPVDSEHKATKLRIQSVAAPHMRAFHLSWISFFACFVSTFAAPPLIPLIRDNLDLTSTDIGNAGVAAVSGAVFARIVMGTLCDLFGPRVASAALMLLTTPAVYCSALANSPASFLLVRFFTGFSLSTFVSTQYWMSSMFSAPVVGTANGVAAGWGNLGGGATQLIMPYVFTLIHHIGATKFTAWRIAFFVPAVFQTLSAYSVFFLGQDLPDGDFAKLQKSGDKHKDKFSQVFYQAITNYRGWILALTYGYCFGVELTVDNIIAQYFYDRFHVNLHTAGIIAASFGLANLFSRPLGGYVSDVMATRYGMRGSLSTSVTVMLVFSVFVQASCGLTYGVVPFVSRRSLGVISGLIGGGGNVGAVLTQVVFFRGSRFKTETGITLMGVTIICCTLPMMFIYFPQWGGLFWGPSSKGITEENYYMSEWSKEEQEQGFHKASLKFANNSKGERGKRVASAPTPLEGTPESYGHV
uniref:Major facilitator superfamily (MFS) profile domain-containing protein n=1 Tax=Daucus carota subsp. sativus TaxID=79200 RepID=A0A166E8J5_DAUCS